MLISTRFEILRLILFPSDIDFATLDISFSPFGQIAICSSVRSFDLQFFYFACKDATVTDAIGLAESCTMAVSGFDVDGSQAPVQTYAFANTNPPNDSMALAALPPRHRGLRNVTFGIANVATETSTTVLAVVDVKHCTYS